jgi:starvation-inducible DNA-binding protein
MERAKYIILITLSTRIGAMQMEQTGEALVQIGLNQEHREQVARDLNSLLANEYLLYTKTLKWHWNVTGVLFGPLHELLNQQYTMLLGFLDRIAERIRALGFYPYGTMQEFLTHATLQESSRSTASEKDILTTLLADHEAIIRQLRPIIALSEKVNDMGSNNFLSELIEKHEKIAWMLRAQIV